MENNTTFETGATSAAVNELILYTDNTKELAEYRDVTYNDFYNFRSTLTAVQMMGLLAKAEEIYKKEMGTPIEMTSSEDMEYCQIYANRFSDWKREKELQAKQK